MSTLTSFISTIASLKPTIKKNHDSGLANCWLDIARCYLHDEIAEQFWVENTGLQLTSTSIIITATVSTDGLPQNHRVHVVVNIPVTSDRWSLEAYVADETPTPHKMLTTVYKAIRPDSVLPSIKDAVKEYTGNLHVSPYVPKQAIQDITKILQTLDKTAKKHKVKLFLDTSVTNGGSGFFILPATAEAKWNDQLEDTDAVCNLDDDSEIEFASLSSIDTFDSAYDSLVLTRTKV